VSPTSTKKPKARKAPRKSTPRKRKAAPRKPSQAITREPERLHEERRGAANSVTVKDETEALLYFAQIDDRLADAWKRDVVMHEGPITIHRVIGHFFDATHYAYVDRRLFWYLKRDPSDPLGAKWEGYLKAAIDAPPGTIVSYVGRDILAKKVPPQLADGSQATNNEKKEGEHER